MVKNDIFGAISDEKQVCLCVNINADLIKALESIIKTLVNQDDEGLIEHSEQIIAARLAIKRAYDWHCVSCFGIK